MEDRPKVATMVSSLANYSATVTAPAVPDAADKAKASPKLGTLAGVYFPCMQNIFGVILFIRMTWIIGTAGVIQGFFIILMCCTCVSTLHSFLMIQSQEGSMFHTPHAIVVVDDRWTYLLIGNQ